MGVKLGMIDLKHTHRIVVKHIIYILAAIAAGLFLFVSGIHCFFRFFTGVPCPSCGMTRAFLSLLKLDFYRSFYYHPLLIPALITAFIAIHMDVPVFKFNKKVCTVYIWGFVAVFFAVYFFRFFMNSIP